MSIIVKTVYAHPNGGSIKYANDKLILSEPQDNDEDDCAAVPIGAGGLRHLADALLALADKVEAEHV